jgi:hypothetical protein
MCELGVEYAWEYSDADISLLTSLCTFRRDEDTDESEEDIDEPFDPSSYIIDAPDEDIDEPFDASLSSSLIIDDVYEVVGAASFRGACDLH